MIALKLRCQNLNTHVKVYLDYLVRSIQIINCLKYLYFLHKGHPRSPEIFYTWPLNSTTIMAKWQLSYPTQDVPTYLNITCFNTNDIEDHITSTISDLIESIQEISIDGFTASTKYLCCITVSSEIGTSHETCQNVTLFDNVEQGKLTMSIVWNTCTFPSIYDCSYVTIL